MIIRIERNKNYTTMSNYHLQDRDLSLKAKGLMSLMLSLPENWNYSVDGLVSICKENATCIESTLKELKSCKYLKVVKKLPNETESGRIEYEYVLYEQKQGVEFLGVEFLGVEFLGVENQGQENTNKLNTNNKYTNKEITNNIKENTKEKEQVYYENTKLNELFLSFLDLRKKLKAQNTDLAIRLLINKLAEYDDDTKQLMIEQSIENSWKSVFPVKNAKKTDKKNNKNLGEWL